MGTRLDFLNWLEPDTSVKILMCLEDPADLVRASSVSRSWHNFVIENGLCKQLCLKMFPQLSRVDHIEEMKSEIKSPSEVGSSRYMEWEALERDHRAYAFFAHGCMSAPLTSCISDAITASSTDNYPEERIHNTLDHRDRIERRASYWSSKGQSNASISETLIYRLCSNPCLITEINIQPFQAYFQPGLPIYSAKSVRFRMGHLKSQMDIPTGSVERPADDKFIWTYTSEAFPMAQENRLQKFKLPEPVLAIGGFMQIELMGRVQRQDIDGLFYICVAHVQAIGRSLAPAFDVDNLEPSGMFVLKYFPEARLEAQQASFPEDKPNGDSTTYLQRRVRDLENILNLLRGHAVEVDYELVEENDESDEDIGA